jgi:hypothetical protein
MQADAEGGVEVSRVELIRLVDRRSRTTMRWMTSRSVCNLCLCR